MSKCLQRPQNHSYGKGNTGQAKASSAVVTAQLEAGSTELAERPYIPKLKTLGFTGFLYN